MNLQVKHDIVFAAVVTYNRKEKLRVCLEKILGQTRSVDLICIIDNASTDGTYDFIRDLLDTFKNISYIHMKQNTGGSGGFHEAFQRFLQSNADWIWGMDDDAYPQGDALERLLCAKSKLSRQVCFCSNVISNGCKSTGFVENPNGSHLVCIREMMFVGFFLPKTLVKCVGLPKANLFIYYDDIDYSERIREAGYQIYTVTDSLIRHPEPARMLAKTVFSKTYIIPQMARWKWYYYVRNGFLVYPRGHSKRRSMLLWNLKMLAGVAVICPKCLKPALKGFIDGLLGRDGKRRKAQ